MRRQRGLIGLTGIAALVGLGMLAKPAVAAVTTEQSASLLVFPKVIANGTRDTIIQITNTSNLNQHAHCFYVNGAPVNSSSPVGPTNPPQCQEIDFDIWLTKQQPTHWVVSAGRQVFSEAPCSKTVVCNPATTGGPSTNPAKTAANCCDAGFDPGRIPPVAPDFTGELLCVLTDASDMPYVGEAIKGEATIEDLANGDVTKYNGIGFHATEGNDTVGPGGVHLCLGSPSASTADCPSDGVRYGACPAAWFLDHYAKGAVGSTVSGPFNEDEVLQPNITVVPCTLNLETQAQTSVTLQFDVINEFESHLSTSTTFSCWASFDLGNDPWSVEPFNLLSAGALGSGVLQTRVRSAQGTPRGVLAVIEETYSIGTATAKTAQNGHTSFADQTGVDVVTIPADQFVQPPQ